MGENTGIEWCHHTFNPWWGCTKVSPACDHCYAETLARRFGYSETGKHFPIWGKDAERRTMSDAYWLEPLKWNRASKRAGERRTVFCGSMCDVMEDHSPAFPADAWLPELRQRLYLLIEATPHLDWLLLTKRPQNFRRFLPQSWLRSPLPNVWLMTTVESQEYAWRAVELLRTPAAVRGLSCEPLLGPLDLVPHLFMPDPHGSPADLIPHGALHWVIAGGESGPGARPSHPDWFRLLRDQCERSDTPFFFKQWGDHDQYGQRVMKKAAGAMLDGSEWREVPR